MKAFLLRFAALIPLVLSGFDRLRFRGDSRLLNNARGVDSYLSQQHVRSTDFPRHGEGLTHTLRSHTEAWAHQHGLPLRHLDSPAIDKEAVARHLVPTPPGPAGPLAVLTCVEQYPELGLCYVRVQSWFPFTVHVGLNGRLWLAQQLQRPGVSFQQQDNLLVAVADPTLAQQLRDAQCHADWPTLLSDLVRPIQPLWDYLHHTVLTPYYWLTEQSEWATDFVFHTPSRPWPRSPRSPSRS
jgi:hypothetical protein